MSTKDDNETNNDGRATPRMASRSLGWRMLAGIVGVAVFGVCIVFKNERRLERLFQSNRSLDFSPLSMSRIEAVETGVLLYPRNQQRFARTLLLCLDDPKCHVLYHHIKKTAGTFVSSSLYPVFENGDRFRNEEWCCTTRMMDQFWNNTEKYCTKQNIVPLEVYGTDYEQILDTCETKYSQSGHTYVGLVTIREPIQRTLSKIHQLCNSNRSRSPTITKHCQECAYHDGSAAFWQGKLNNTNRRYQEVDAYLSKRFVSPHKTNPILVIDSTMINDLFEKLNMGLEERNLPKIPKGESNPEDLSVCAFAMTSHMFKQLRTASLIYLNLWTAYR